MKGSGAWLVAVLLTFTVAARADPAPERWDALAALRTARPLKATASLLESAPLPATGSGRIVGGTVAARAQFPWQAALLPVDGITTFCGGSLVSARWVLTAAFCLFRSEGAVVYVGAYDLSAPDDALQVQQVGAAALHLNPAFEYATLNNNIALVRLGNDVTLNEWVQPVQLVLEETRDLTGSVARVSGWGLEHDNSITLSNKLRYAELPLIDNYSCRQYYGLILVTDSTVCADGRDATGAIATFCAGDLGGPLLLQGSPPTQVGVASFVASVSCERGYPSGYERTAAHAAWIRQLTGL